MPQTSKQYIQRLQIIHGAQITMIVAFNLIAFFSRPPENENSNLFLYVFIAFFISSLLISRFIFGTLLSKISTEPSLGTKLTKYLTAFIVRLAFLEMPALFAAVAVLTTGNTVVLLGTAVILILFFVYRPSADLLKQELQLSSQERSLIENPDGIVME